MARTILPNQQAKAIAIALLKQGKIMALPTETVYGLAGDATQGKAVAAIYQTKERPHFNPLIAHVSHVAMVERYCVIDALSRQLMERFWPGPLTLVLPLKTDHTIHPLATAGLPTLAVRQPVGIFSEIVEAYDKPLVAPSANSSGRLSPTTAAAVAQDIGDKIPLIVDAGPCRVGIESTIIKVTDIEVLVLRPGGLALSDLEEQIDRPLAIVDQRAAIEAPGMLQSHYAPNASIRLNAREVFDGEALLRFGDQTIANSENASYMLNLSEGGDTREAAVNLFAYLKILDDYHVDKIAVQPIPMVELGIAINDRLTRAAAPRSFAD